jgi:hypothetical protein
MECGMKKALLALIICCFTVPAFAKNCVFPDRELSTRPHAEGSPTEVDIRVYVNDIAAIHDADQTFIADVFFRANWHDPRLAHSGEAPCAVGTQPLWTPVFQLLNRRHVERIRPPELSVAPDGTVTFILRSFGEYSFRADLTDFPFDHQQLSFNIVSTYTKEEVTLYTEPAYLGLSSELSIPNWTITMAEHRSLTEYVPPVDKTLVRLDLVLDASRLTGYYTWQQLLPLLLVVMMTWVVFWIPLEFVPPRVGLAATSMLTLIAYRFAMSSVLPPIAYLTRLDIFMIGSSVLVFMALSVAVAVTYLGDQHSEELAVRVNQAARWLTPLGLLLVSLLAFYV